MSRQSKKRRREEEAQREELLAPDAFESQGATSAAWFQKNVVFVLGGLGVVLALIIGVELFRSSGASAAGASTRGLIEALDEYRDVTSLQTVLTSTSADIANAGYEKAKTKLDALIGSETNPEVLALAKLYRADLDRRLGHADAAIEGYSAYLGSAQPTDELKFFATEGKGYALEAAGKTDEALAVFETLAAMERYADYGLKHVARILEAKGDSAGAKAAYEKIKGREPASPLRDFAEQKLVGLD